jgi:pSer/pThr/pTyr-binding forkhead associated (FHA) protein
VKVELLINGERLVELNPGVYRVGRSVYCDIHLEDPTASRVHATILIEDDVVKITDGDYLTGIRSANGLEINGKPLNPMHGAELSHNDQIVLSRNTTIQYFQTTIEPDPYDPDTTVL